MKQGSFDFGRPEPAASTAPSGIPALQPGVPRLTGSRYTGWLIRRRGPLMGFVAVQNCVAVASGDDAKKLAAHLDRKVDGVWFTGYVVVLNRGCPHKAIAKGKGVFHGG